jgi:uncharacterized protein
LWKAGRPDCRTRRRKPTAVRATATGIEIDARVIPRSKKNRIDGERDGSLLVRLAAAPVEDAANDALVSFLADLLDVPRRAVRIVSGRQSRRKRVAVDGVTVAFARDKIAAA